MDNTWLIIVMVALVPVFFWARVRRYNRGKKSVTARCPQCGSDNQLSEVQNYTCNQCGSSIVFFDEEGNVDASVEYYDCEACGEKNFVGILTCTGCGLANTKGIPD